MVDIHIFSVYDNEKANFARIAAKEAGLPFKTLKRGGQRYVLEGQICQVPEDHSRIRISAATIDDFLPFWLRFLALSYQAKNPDLKI